MEQLSPSEHVRLEELRAFIYHWSRVADLVFQLYNTKSKIRWLNENVKEADDPVSLIGTVKEAKDITRYPTDGHARQEIIDAVLDATKPPAKYKKTFDWEGYAEAVGGWVDFFDQSLKVNAEYGIY